MKNLDDNIENGIRFLSKEVDINKIKINKDFGANYDKIELTLVIKFKENIAKMILKWHKNVKYKRILIILSTIVTK
jgi:hypothetical protein